MNPWSGGGGVMALASAGAGTAVAVVELACDELVESVVAVVVVLVTTARGCGGKSAESERNIVGSHWSIPAKVLP